MQFGTSTQIGQNSHLVVTLSGGTLSCLLIVADYETGVSFSEHISCRIPKRFDINSLDDLLKNLLTQWEKDIDWDLVDCNTGVCLPLAEGGSGIAGAALYVSSEYFDKKYSSSLLGTKAQLIEDRDLIEGAVQYLRILNTTNMVFVFLNWDSFTVLYLDESSAESVSEVSDAGTHVSEFKVERSNRVTQLEQSIRRLLTVNIKKGDLMNLYQNVTTEKINSSNSQEIWDVFRSSITASLFNLKDKCFSKFGMETEDAHLVITGDLTRFMPENQIFLAVVDGLQLRGKYKVFIDNEDRILAGLKTFKSRDFPCPVKEVYPPGYMYLSTEKGGSGKIGQESFRGKIAYVPSFEGKSETDLVKNNKSDDSSKASNSKVTDRSIEDEYLVGQVGQIYSFSLNGKGKLYLKPSKAVYFPNLEREKDQFRLDFGEDITRLVIDCRMIPVVYGPDYNANYKRVSEWIAGLNLGRQEVE